MIEKMNFPGIVLVLLSLLVSAGRVTAGGIGKNDFAAEVNISMLWLDQEVMEHVVVNESGLANRDFNFSSNRMIGLGLSSYARKNPGIAYGGGVRLAYKVFKSEEYAKMYPDTGNDHDSIPTDSLEMDVRTSLRVLPVHLGFCFEKSFGLGPVNLHSGILVGGGAFMVFKKTRKSDDLFTSIDDDEDFDEEEFGFALAPFLSIDLNAGVGFQFSDNIGLGVDFVLETKYLPSGFITGTDLEDMTTVNPGGRLRLIFG